MADHDRFASDIGHLRSHGCSWGLSGRYTKCLLATVLRQTQTLALQHIGELSTYESSSSSALAACKSGISKPSVKRP
jgi:hypothetical protein